MNSKEVKYEINFIIKDNIKQFQDYIKKEINSSNLKYIIAVFNKYDKDCLDIYVKKEKHSYIYTCNDKEFFNLNDIVNEHLIVPKLFCNNLSGTNYKDKMIKLEHKKDNEKNRLFKKYDRIFRKNFKVNNGLNDIYEWYTGAVFFKDYEWAELSNSSLKKLFESKIDNYYVYSLPLDNGVILRSSEIYYYFSTDISRFKKPTIIQIEKWFNNVSNFLKETIKCLNSFKVNDNYDKRLLLGALDNVRNIVLILANCELMTLTKDSSDFLYNSSFHKKVIDNYFDLIEQYQSTIESICFEEAFVDNNVKIIREICEKVLQLQCKTFSKVKKINNEFILSKCFNPLREIDNYYENYIICKNVMQKDLLTNKPLNLIGILYGALELLFLLKRNAKGKINISFLFQNHGMYLDRQKRNRKTMDINMFEYGKVNKNMDTYLVDDNMMSGLTMQFAYNKLKLNGFNNINGIIVLRHPNTNRIAQLEHFDVGLNIDLVDKYVLGMITDTPYTKIKKGTNYNNMFVNELNIFSIMTEVFLKALYCNNSFIKDSQVDIFLGYSEGKND